MSCNIKIHQNEIYDIGDTENNKSSNPGYIFNINDSSSEDIELESSEHSSSETLISVPSYHSDYHISHKKKPKTQLFLIFGCFFLSVIFFLTGISAGFYFGINTSTKTENTIGIRIRNNNERIITSIQNHNELNFNNQDSEPLFFPLGEENRKKYLICKYPRELCEIDDKNKRRIVAATGIGLIRLVVIVSGITGLSILQKIRYCQKEYEKLGCEDIDNSEILAELEEIKELDKNSENDQDYLEFDDPNSGHWICGGYCTNDEIVTCEQLSTSKRNADDKANIGLSMHCDFQYSTPEVKCILKKRAICMRRDKESFGELHLSTFNECTDYIEREGEGIWEDWMG